MRATVVAALLIASCARKESAGAPVDAAESAAPLAPSAPLAVASAEPVQAPATEAGTAFSGTGAKIAASSTVPTEARRTRITRLAEDGALAENGELVKKHFGGALPATLLVQTAELSDGPSVRRGLLVDAAEKNLTAPLVIVVDDKGKLVWSKERPTAGILPPVGQVAIAAGPEGRVVLVACDPPTASVAVRLWDEDGAPFADFQALEVEGCDQVSALYWPRHGWILAAARAGALRAQLLTEAGALAWGRGVTLGSPWRMAAPAAFVVDTPDSVMLVQYGHPAPAPDIDPKSDHALAFRYDGHAKAMWGAPVDLGAVARVPSGSERVLLTRPREGVVRAKLAKGATVDIRSNGEIVR